MKANSNSAIDKAADTTRRSSSPTFGSGDRVPVVLQMPGARSVYEQLRKLGFVPAEAGNLTAYLNGLEPVAGGWSILEVERLLFASHLVDLGAIRP